MLTIKVKMCAGYLHILGTIRYCKLIADLYNGDALHMKCPPIKQGAMVESFLLDTVRHISSNL